MKKAATERAKGVRNQSAGSRKRGEGAKKMLLGANKAANPLNTQHLTFSGYQNGLLFELRPPSNPRIRPKIRFQVSGAQSGFRSQDSGLKRQTLGTCPQRNNGNELLGLLWTICHLKQAKRKLSNSKKAERRGNVYENKGALWKIEERRGNSMKIKVVIRLKPELH